MAGHLKITSAAGVLVEENELFDMRHGVGLGGLAQANDGWLKVTDHFSVSNQSLHHQTLQIVRAVDAFSPRLMSALTNYEVFPSVEIKWHWVNKETDAVEYDYRMVLDDAQLIYAAPWDFNSEDGVVKEMLAFSYREIAWKYFGPEPTEGDFVAEANSEGFF